MTPEAHCLCEQCKMTVMQCKERAAKSEAVLDELKKDLKTRFIPSNNQWSKGRNSGLIECCNIIDELRQAKEREQE